METDITIFAAAHNLTLTISERHNEARSSMMRYYAKFNNVEVSTGNFLTSTFGNGRTAEEAIADYAKNISGQRLVVNAYNFNRYEVNAPTLTFKAPKKVQITVSIDTDYESSPPRY